jgi:hypothetical protein
MGLLPVSDSETLDLRRRGWSVPEEDEGSMSIPAAE